MYSIVSFSIIRAEWVNKTWKLNHAKCLSFSQYVKFWHRWKKEHSDDMFFLNKTVSLSPFMVKQNKYTKPHIGIKSIVLLVYIHADITLYLLEVVFQWVAVAVHWSDVDRVKVKQWGLQILCLLYTCDWVKCLYLCDSIDPYIFHRFHSSLVI